VAGEAAEEFEGFGGEVGRRGASDRLSRAHAGSPLGARHPFLWDFLAKISLLLGLRGA
jgi:hypothetical protein